MIIGNFKHDKAEDTYRGELATLTIAARKVVFQPNEARGDKAPSYRVVSPSKTGKASSALRGRSAARRVGITSRSSSTIRAWRSRSTAPWSSQARARVSSSSGRVTGASRKGVAAGAVRKGRP
jgi:hypothetical protein